jgi:hypothetical protein
MTRLVSTRLRIVPLVASLAALQIGCASTRSSSDSVVNPVNAARLDSLAGRWDFSVDVGTRQTPGELWLFRRGSELIGTLAPTGTNTLPVRALVLRGDSTHLVVDTPEGPVLFDGVVAAGHASMRGIVTYHQGQRYPMTATKRPAARPPG